MPEKLSIAVIAGEVSGDLLGGDLIAALRQRFEGEISLIGVGGDALGAEGLTSLFDYSELSIMGFTQVIANLPTLLRRIKQTADAIIEAKPDVMVIIDSPDFTHRVAKRVRKALPDLPVINYVCPSVWAWKEYRAREMNAYVDHVLAVLPFEPAAMERLGGPPTTFVGHRLTRVDGVLAARQNIQATGREPGSTILLLPGSRGGEIKSLMPVFREVAAELSVRNENIRFMMPTVRYREAQVREALQDWPVQPEVVLGDDAKWAAFASADAAVAASGTVILELALSGVPVVSAYKADFIGRFMLKKISIWSASLPNLIADSPLVPEYFNDTMRAGALVRWMELLSGDTLQRQAMMDGFDRVWNAMKTDLAPGEKAASVLLDVLRQSRNMPH
ncbi:lipid-A-disaccharide synthase [Martelella mediterranea]|uniref:Lipid-A-disaccharide synthase n=1 Tax=Martelella mediterranea TaxID=293089 RepID=A0A4R3NTX8_9HYPH|nr:lipid-A-disaccharide synthase [Martelella mediterranea]TCT40389.1 lipid-A-disaccharide synthase [Martelella mediterranea]